MKQWWAKYAAKIDALTQRERMIVFIAALVVVVFIMDTVFMDPPAKRIQALTAQMQQQQGEMQKLQQQLEMLQRTDPDAANRAQRDNLTQQVTAVNEVLNSMQQNLVPAQRMNALLQDMLNRNPRLQLIAMQTLPVTTVVEKKPAAKTDANAGGAAPPPQDHVSSGDDIFEHGVEITLQGSYADLHDYLLRLERLPSRMYWSRARLSTKDYPRLTLTITIYTLSLDKAWLEV